MSKLGYKTLRENVVQEIRQKILKQELKPGMRIVEQALSDELQVSRGPIREALRQLEQEGLVEYTRNVGCSVKEITIRDLYEIYLLRSTYEILAVKLVKGKFREADIRKMERILDMMKNVTSYEEVMECDHLLHQLIIQQADSERIVKVWSDLNYGSLVGCYILGFDEKKTIERQYQIHRPLVDACATGDEAEICRMINKHYMNSIRYFLEQEKLPEGGFDIPYEFS